MRKSALFFLLMVAIFFPLSASTAQQDEEMISPDNVSTLTKLASLTRGQLHQLAWSEDGSELLLETGQGILTYNASDWDAAPRKMTQRALGTYIEERNFDEVANGIERLPEVCMDYYSIASIGLETEDFLLCSMQIWVESQMRTRGPNDPEGWQVDILWLQDAQRNLIGYLAPEDPLIDNLLISKKGEIIALTYETRPVEIWDIQAGALTYLLPQSTVADLSQDGTLIVLANDNEITLWDLTTGGKYAVLSDFPARILDVSLHPNKTKLAALDTEGRAYVLNLTTGEMEAISDRFSGSIFRVMASPTENTLLIASWDSVVTLDATTGKQITSVKMEPFLQGDYVEGMGIRFKEFTSLSTAILSPDYQTLAGFVGNNTTLGFTDIATGELIHQLQLEGIGQVYMGFAVSQPRFSLDGTWMGLSVIDSDSNGIHQVHVYDLLGGASNATFYHSYPIDVFWDSKVPSLLGGIGQPEIAFNPDGRSFVASGMQIEDGNPVLGLSAWSTDGGERLWNTRYQSDVVLEAEEGFYYQNAETARTLTFSPNGEWLAFEYTDIQRRTKIRLVDPMTGAILRTLPLPANTNHVNNILFTPDSKMMIIQSEGWHQQGEITKTTFYNTQTWRVAHEIDTLGNLILAPDGKTFYFVQGQGSDSNNYQTLLSGFIEVWGLPHRADDFTELQGSGFITDNLPQTINFSLLQEQSPSTEVNIPQPTSYLYHSICPDHTSRLSFPGGGFTTTTVDLKAAADANAPVVKQLEPETYLLIIGGAVCRPDGVYWRIIYDLTQEGGIQGWVRETEGTAFVISPLINGNPAPDSLFANCTDTPPRLTPRLTIGGLGRVIPGQPNNLRTLPDQKSDSLGQIPGGASFVVLDGPVCGEANIVWWQVEYQGYVGWTGEGQNNTYWTEPYDSDSTTVSSDSTTTTNITACPNGLVSRLIIGSYGRVLPGPANNVRSQPTRNSQQLGQIPGGGEFKVLEGPECGGDIVYWLVDYNGLIGWTGESQGNTYWVEPIQ